MDLFDSEGSSDGQDSRGDTEARDPTTARSGQKMRSLMKARLGDETYSNWFGAMEIDQNDGAVLRISLPTMFLRNWVRTHYADVLLECAKVEFIEVQRIDVNLRQPKAAVPRGDKAASQSNFGRSSDAASDQNSGSDRAGAPMGLRPMAVGNIVPTSVNGFEGSPLDSKYTFENFLVGPANRMAHAAAIQVAETVFAAERGFNPLVLHSSVGLGKSHLLHAIAWEVRRRFPQAKVLYLTAERFRFQFVEAIKTQDTTAFKDKFRSVDILLIDDFEYMQGDKTEQEFEHIINALIDGGRQVVVASGRPPAQMDRLNDRMRSRLSRGLVTEISALDQELRLRILERRVKERQGNDPLFEIPRAALELLSDRLTESGRELEGAVNRLYATWQLMRQPITVDNAEAIIRDLLAGIEPRRVKIDDILRIVSRHFAVSKADILSQRRHRSVVWPRQIGMYLAKQLTARSLPEIGRRFGDRDHTTVLHAIRKIDRELEANTRLRDELEELKKQLNR